MGAVRRYEELKARGGSLDFLDLLLKARDLVKSNEVVRRGFQKRFTHIFVDEFQDTDPLQAEILLLLAAADPSETDWRKVTPLPGHLFLVGDPKQSIYRFRRADVAVYRDVCERLVAVRCDSGEADRQLSQRAADSGLHQRRLRPGDDRRCVHASGRLRARCRRIERILADSLRSWRCRFRRRTARGISPPMAIEKSLPDAVGAFVDWIVSESGWKVTERTGEAAGRRCRPSTSACCSVDFSVSAKTSRSRTCARSRRAASVTSWSAARHFTIARRSKRSAPRWRRSNGPTTSCRCLRRCAARCSRLVMKNCSNGSWPAATAVSACSIRFGFLRRFRRTSRRSVPRCSCCSNCIGGATMCRWPKRFRNC